MKTCPRCNRLLSDASFYSRSDGRLSSYCKPCNREHNRQYDRKPKPYVPMHTSDPLKLALRDMPGNRGPMLGAVEFGPVEYLEAA